MSKKLIAAGIGLFGYGVIIGWAVTGDQLEAKMKGNQRLLGDIIKRQQGELDGAQKLIGIKIPDSVGQTPEPEKVEPLVEGETAKVPYHKMAGTDAIDEKYRGETPAETRENLKDMIATYTTDPEDAEAFGIMAAREVDEGPDNTPPFVISESDYSFDEEGDSYEKHTIKYYPKDRVLLDDEGDKVPEKDVDWIVGWKNLQRFGDESNNPDVVYIRNRRLMVDYEVVQETEDVLPAHIRYDMDRHEFEVQQAAGLTRFRRSDV